MFDRYVVAQHQRPTAKRILILGAAVVHGLFLVALVIYSFIHVEEVTPPPLTVVFMTAPPPPPPPPKGVHHTNPTKPKPHPHIPKPQPVQPTIVQPLQPKPEEKPPEPEEDPDDEPEGDPNGQVGGVNGGVVGGVLGGQVTPTPPPPPIKPKNVPPHQLEEAKLAGDFPELPDIVKIQRKGTGLAVFRGLLCIDQSGSVSSVKVLVGIPGADEVIVAGLRGWRYKPQPIPICSMIELQYQIE